MPIPIEIMQVVLLSMEKRDMSSQQGMMDRSVGCIEDRKLKRPNKAVVATATAAPHFDVSHHSNEALSKPHQALSCS